MEISATQKLMLAAAKSMLGDLSVQVDRQRQLVTINQNGEVKDYTYGQLADLAEQLFPFTRE